MVGGVIIVVLVVGLCVVCFKLGQRMAWDYIAQNYIAIHKSAIIGPILIKKGDKKYEKRNSAFSNKKTFKQKR